MKKTGVGFKREMEFSKNYFNTIKDFVYQPATFNLGITSYRPDFYDIKNNIWIEVVGSREAYRQNKAKYALFRYIYPELKFELRAPCGTLINEIAKNKNLIWPESVYTTKEYMRKYHESRRKQNETKRIMV